MSAEELERRRRHVERMYPVRWWWSSWATLLAVLALVALLSGCTQAYVLTVAVDCAVERDGEAAGAADVGVLEGPGEAAAQLAAVLRSRITCADGTDVEAAMAADGGE